MTTSTRRCDAPGCALSATLTLDATAQGHARVAWPDGKVELLLGLPPDGSIRCPPHRPGSRYSHHCRHGFTHARTEDAFACAGHGSEGQAPAAFGLHVAGR